MANNNGGINLSNLFNLGKLGNMFGVLSNGGGSNPLNALTRMFGGGNNQRRNSGYRCTVKVLPLEEAYRKIKCGNVFLLDVRTEMEYRTLKIKGSVNIPLDRLQAEIPSIVTNKEEQIIIYCQTGSRVRRAMQIMWSLGYTNLCIWEGGGLNNFAFQDLIVYNYNDCRVEQNRIENKE